MFIYIWFYFSLLEKYINSETCFEYSCEECESSEYGKCIKCRENFQLIDGTCPCDDTSCALCLEPLSKYSCLLCKRGYHRENNACICNIDYCQICGEDKCLKCLDSYRYDDSLKKCLKRRDNAFTCYDNNCKFCYTREEKSCYECNIGYYLKEGVCKIANSANSNGICSSGYYEKDSYCYLKCQGLNCNKITGDNNSCDNNKCIQCFRNDLSYVEKCQNKELCRIDGCKICLTENECAECVRGYYYYSGKCYKCSDGCSLCTNANECDYCISGYNLDNEKKCVFSNSFDFNTILYTTKKEELIRLKNHPNEYNRNSLEEVFDDSSICGKVNDYNDECLECTLPYKLKRKKCISTCTDSNCKECDDNNECKECKDEYTLEDKKCIIKCSENCEKCQNRYTCIKCRRGKTLSNGKCIDISEEELNNNQLNQQNQEEQVAEVINNQKNKGKNLFFLIYIFTGVLVLVAIIIFIIICIKRRKHFNNNLDNLNNINRNQQAITPIQRPNENNNNQGQDPYHNIKYKSETDELSEKIKIEKDFKKHKKNDLMSSQSGSLICNVCFKTNCELSHFKCGCSFQVCKECHAQVIEKFHKCPGCRADI